MRQKKVLVISPVPSHPQNAGGRSRIYSMLKLLRRNGCYIHFIYYDTEKILEYIKAKPDIAAMKKEWDEFTYYDPYTTQFKKRIYDICKGYHHYIGLIGKVLRKNIPIIYKIFKPFFPTVNFDEIKYGNQSSQSILDACYPEKLNHIISKTCSNRLYDVILVEFSYMSKAFELFPDVKLKILDTHNALSREEVKFREAHTSKSKKAKANLLNKIQEDERNVLSRADIIIAIQDEEKKYFDKILNHERKVITIGHHVKIVEPIYQGTGYSVRKKILFVGTAIGANVKGMDQFMKNIFPKILQDIPELELIIVGNVCEYMPEISGCVKLGEVRDLDSVYAKADIVIAPIFFGTGLKTKVVEALGRGKTIISTSHASEGLEQIVKIKNSPILIANTPEEFRRQIILALADKRYLIRSRNAINAAKKYNKDIEEKVKKLIQ